MNRIDEYRDRLARAFGDHSRQPDLLALLRELVTPEPLAAFLRETSEDQELSRTMAAKSYGHALGFDKLVVVSPAEFPVPYELRIHIWQCAGAGADSDVHTHGWDFASCVLYGKLNCEQFVPGSESGHEPFVQVTYSRTDQGRYAVTEKGIVHLRRVEDFELGEEDGYFQPYDVLHRVRCVSPGGACTVVLQGVPRTKSSDVYVPPGKTLPEARESLSMPAEKYRSLLQRVRLAISG